MNLEDVLLRGLAAARPAATAVAAGTLYYSTDTSTTDQSDGATWSTYADGGAAGITQLTGDVTAGPGSGSQATTIAANAVTTAKILNDNVTLAKLVNISAASRLLGRGSAGGAGDPEEITLGSGLTMTGTSLAAAGGASSAAFQFAGGVAAGHSPADSATLRFANQPNVNPATADPGWTPNIPRTGTISRVFGDFLVFGTLGSAQNVTVRVRNITANTNQDVTTTLQMTAASNPFNNVAMTLAVTAGDRICIEFVTPVWTTNPTAVIYNATVEITY